MEVSVQLSDVLSEQEWDAYVEGHPLSSHSHRYGWRFVVENVYGHKGFYITARQHGGSVSKIVGVLPLVFMNSILTGRKLVSMPFLDTGGILSDDPAIEKRLLEKAIYIGEEEKVDYIELRHATQINTHQSPRQGTNDYDYQVSNRKAGFELALSDSSVALMASFKSKLRSQLKKPEKLGLVCETGGRRLLKRFYMVFAHNMRDLGSPVHSLRFFESVIDMFPGEVVIFIVGNQTTDLAAGIAIHFKNRLVNPWAASLRAYRKSGANMHLYRGMLEYACDHGLGRFDFGRSSYGSSHHRFKIQWGAEPSRMNWYYFPIKKRLINPEKECLDLLMWNKLPVVLTRFAGPIIRKNISL